jgi:hypothetical protein
MENNFLTLSKRKQSHKQININNNVFLGHNKKEAKKRKKNDNDKFLP